jgi:hypothetical protein
VTVKIRPWEWILIPDVLERTPHEVPSAVITSFRAHRAGRTDLGSRTSTCHRQESGWTPTASLGSGISTFRAWSVPQERLVQGVADVRLVEKAETAAHRQIRRGTDTHVQTVRGAGGNHPPLGRGQQPVPDFLQLTLAARRSDRGP